jgi:GNAT superfamily N-acetyltransferase
MIDISKLSESTNPASLKLRRTSSDDKDFHMLVERLDKDLLERYNELQLYYRQFNKIENNPTVLLAYINDEAAGCGCFKPFDDASVEIKRMYVADEHRGKGIGEAILKELEKWAAESGYSFTVLETGNNQPEAIHLYQKLGYKIIPNYGQYADMKTSICMKKELS